jgi:hypothetical protein
MSKITAMDELNLDGGPGLKPKVESLERELQTAVGAGAPVSPLAHLAPAKRKMYEHVFGLIYECSANQVAAKALIDRILAKVT